jgi:serine/threonine protein phosphatase PrpC
VRGGFATCLVLRLGIDGACLLARAGHLARFLNEHELDLPPTLPLGVVDAAEYAAIPLHLAAGDRLALYTDGLVEARNASGELLGFDWTRNLLTGNLDAHAAVAAAVAFGQDDDMTVLILTRDAAKPERARTPTLVAARATEA